jgi:hypothetical protein
MEFVPVYAARRHVQHVSRWPGSQQLVALGRTGELQDPPEPRYVGMYQVHGADGRFLSPHPIDNRALGDEPVGVEQQRHKDGTLLGLP